MGSNYLIQAVLFLLEVVFGLYILAVLLRFMLAQVHADFYNPLSQFIVKITNPLIKPLRRLIPGYMGIDWPSIVLMFFIQGVEIVIISLIATGHIPAPMGVLVMTLGELLKTVIYVYMFIIIVQVVISWVNPGAYNPMTVIMYQLSGPILKLARRLVPPAGGFDWSVLVVMIVLNLLIILMVYPVLDMGRRLAY